MGISCIEGTETNMMVDLYKPRSQNDEYFFGNMLLILNKLTSKYGNIMLMGDLHLTFENKNLEIFISTSDLECMIKKLHVSNLCSS